ncbi:hypothetical protein [Bosea sp. 124]|uniref:hypothetical protein n=1 Tax=Bosea sp. 124 TaxID=2135642 RepID=UPI0011B1F2E1|nr:hypothetical protein [Bosea sp. 124]
MPRDTLPPPKSPLEGELRLKWELHFAANHFQRIFNVSLFPFIGRVVKVFSPPASAGLLFEFREGMRESFATLVDRRAFPPATLNEAIRAVVPGYRGVIPDNPGVSHRDAWWRQAAAGAAIGQSFREEGTSTGLHIAFNKTLCDVHVDRNGFVISRDGFTHWDLNGLLRHLTIDLAGDKATWAVHSAVVLDRRRRPIIQATLGPWFAVDLPSRDANDRTAVKVGIQISGTFGSR